MKVIVDLDVLNRVDAGGNDNKNGLLVDYAELEACPEFDLEWYRERLKLRMDEEFKISRRTRKDLRCIIDNTPFVEE